jgi:hypothetical protein
MACRPGSEASGDVSVASHAEVGCRIPACVGLASIIIYRAFSSGLIGQDPPWPERVAGGHMATLVPRPCPAGAPALPR